MRLILIVLLSLGMCLRFVNLDHKIYWYDETFTSLRSSGYTEAEVVEHFSQSTIVQVGALQHYQQPDLNRGAKATWHSLASEDPQHPPLYYILTSYWMRAIGHSVTAMRLLPALLSVLAFPCAYWLCQELFAKAEIASKLQVSWMAIGLIAISPFHILYAQEAREYSLWSVTTFLATATLLHALRVNTITSWLIYTIALATSFYTFLFSIWIAIAHSIYVFIVCKFRFSQIAPHLFASLLAVAAFFPWVWVTAQNLHQIQTVTEWTTSNRSLLSLVMSWANMLGRLFYDRGTSALDRIVQLGLILLVGIAFYRLCRRTTKSVWLLIVTLTAVPILALVLPDVILGGGRSTAPRYVIPALCSIQLAMAYLLATKCSDTKRPDQYSNFHVKQQWRWIAAIVFAAGIWSGLTIAPAQTWWIKPHNQENLAIAQIVNQVVNQSTHLLVISDAETADLLSLSYSLEANTNLLIRPRCYTCPAKHPQGVDRSILEIPASYSDVFLFHPRATKEWKKSLSQVSNYHFEPVVSKQAEILWKLVTKKN